MAIVLQNDSLYAPRIAGVVRPGETEEEVRERESREFRPISNRSPISRDPAKKPGNLHVFADHTIGLLSAWDVRSAMSALDSHSMGQFSQSGLLLDAMLADTAFDAVSQTRAMSLISRPVEIDATQSLVDDDMAAEAKLAVASIWEDVLPEHTQADLLVSGLAMGFRVAQIIWREKNGFWIPYLQPWHPSLVYYRQDIRAFIAITMSGPVEIVPGDGQWLLYTPHGEYRGWQHGLIRSCVVPFLSRCYSARDWNRYNEVHGLPTRILEVPAQSDEDEKGLLLNAAGSLQNETTLALPQGVNQSGDPTNGYKFSLVEATSNTWQAFKALRDDSFNEISIRWLGQNLTTNIGGSGSYAAASVHERVKYDYTRADAKTLSSCLYRDVFRPFCAFNFGDPDIAPKARWLVDPDEDKGERAKYIIDVATAANVLVTCRAPVDMRAMLEQANIPTLPDGEPAPLLPEVEIKQSQTESVLSSKISDTKSRSTESLRGQLYVDAVAVKGAKHCHDELSGFTDSVRQSLANATSWDDAERRILELAPEIDPTTIADVMQSALTMAHLAGRKVAE